MKRVHDAVFTHSYRIDDFSHVRFTSATDCKNHVWLCVPMHIMQHVPLFSLVEIEWDYELDSDDGERYTFVALRNVRPARWDAPAAIDPPASRP